jgi:RNA polymerase sigma-70 factor, ECF subfamily
MILLDANASVPLLLSAPPRDGALPSGRVINATSEAAAGTSGSPNDSADARLEQWFRTHFSKLWRFVARLGVPSGIIDDVVQDAFIAANRRHADVLEGREWPFLVGAALRLAANYRLRASARREVPEGGQIEDTASALPSAEQLLIEKRSRQELEQVLSTLSEAHRAVFVLYELEGFSAPEIAELTGLPLGTVASRLGRARSKFSDAAARLQRARLAQQEKS